MKHKYLRRKSDEFRKGADFYKSEGIYSLAAFSLGQALQLLLKYFLVEKTEDYPKTHSIKTLINEVGKLCPDIKELMKENPSVIGNIESAYILSRYFPTEFSKEEVEEMVEFFELCKKVIKNCL